MLLTQPLPWPSTSTWPGVIPSLKHVMIDAISFLARIRDLAERGGVSAVRVTLADNEDNASPERAATTRCGGATLGKRCRPARALPEARMDGMGGLSRSMRTIWFWVTTVLAIVAVLAGGMALLVTMLRVVTGR